MKQSLIDGAIWPIERAALAALIDMGLSDERIAAYEANANLLRLHLHELAGVLQAASNYVEALRDRVSQAGGDQTVEAVVVEKVAQQLDRTQEGFRRLRNQLGAG